MKQKQLLLSLLALLGSTTLHAYDFVSNGIYYSILSEEDRTCEVTFESEGTSSYSGWIDIPESVNRRWSGDYTVVGIGDNAFSYCQLDYISLSSTITRIGENAFSSCTGISALTIPENIEYIGNGAFQNSDLAGSIYIPLCCKYIGDLSFAWTNISSVEFQPSLVGSNLRKINTQAFWSCDNLSNVNLYALDYEFGEAPFGNCKNLSSIDGWGLESPLTKIIDGCLYQYTIRDGEQILKLICCPGGKDNYIFNEQGLEKIGDYAFAGCHKITTLDIPSTVKSIGDYALFMPTGPEKDYTYRRVNIPQSVEDIGGCPFGWFGHNWDIYLYNTNIKDISYTSIYKHGTIHIPYGTLSSFNVKHVEQVFDIVNDIQFEEAVANIGSAGVATYCSDYDLDFTDVSGLKAYIASGFEPSTGTLVLTRALKVPAGEGLYLVGDAGTYKVPVSETDMVYSNLLKGVTTATTISPTDGSNTNFILANGSHGVGFYTLSAAGELAAGKAYLQLPTASVSSVKAINLAFGDDEETAVQSIKEETNVQSIFNLQGQRVDAPIRGLYIIDGKKVFIK